MQILAEKIIIYGMKPCRILSEAEKLHFVGAGGVGMSALAQYALACGKKVSGSDASEGEQVEKLISLGAKIAIGHARKNARGADAVIYSSAVLEDNPELQFARDNKKPLFSRAEMLACAEAAHPFSAAVSGCHGKTTCTAMLAHMFVCAGVSATCMIGGDDLSLGNFTFGKDIFLTEACEYKRNFLHLKPDVAVILNIDDDHLDCYGDMDALTEAYAAFAGRGVSVVCADDRRAMRAAGKNEVSFGIENKAMYAAENLRKTRDGKWSFTVSEYGVKRGRIRLNVTGKHNVYNALAAFAAARCCGVSPEDARRGAEAFRGVKRRCEYLGELGGAKVIADYAHHPREIAAALSGAKRPLVVFQPHTYSRTRLLMGEFVETLKKYPSVIFPAYAARETYDFEGSAFRLCAELKAAGADAVYAETPAALMEELRARAGDFGEIYVLGAGDLYGEVKKRMKKFPQRLDKTPL